MKQLKANKIFDGLAIFWNIILQIYNRSALQKYNILSYF